MYKEKYFLISDYQSMELLGVNGLFTSFRVDSSSLPEGFYKYSLREGADNPFSTVKEDVWANHMGDFICKEELDLNGQDELDLFGDYSFTNEEVDLDTFFGEDIKSKVAQELDAFYYDFDTYDYQDKVPTDASREDVVDSLRKDLSDKECVKGIIGFFEKLLEDNEVEDYLSDETILKARSFIRVLTKINESNHDVLDVIVERANNIKEQQRQNDINKQQEIQQQG